MVQKIKVNKIKVKKGDKKNWVKRIWSKIILVKISWDIANIEFLWWGGGSFSCLTQPKVMLGWVELWLSLGFDNIS